MTSNGISAEEADLRKKLGIPDGSKVTLIDMDKHRVVPVLTAGWTDEQIKGKTPDDLRQLIRQRELGLAELNKTVDNERGEIDKLRQVLERRLQLGD